MLAPPAAGRAQTPQHPPPNSHAHSVTGLSYALQLAASRLLRAPLAPLLPLSLPLALASFVPFALDVPPTSTFSFLGLSGSDKAFVYLSGLQLLLAVGRRGLAAGGLCLLAGVLHRANFLGLRKLQVSADSIIESC